MNEYSIGFDVFSDVLSALGQRAREYRLAQNLTQSQLAARSAVGVATLHRFEKTGHISLENALRIATALGADNGFRALFKPLEYATLDEVLERNTPRRRMRARRKI